MMRKVIYMLSVAVVFAFSTGYALAQDTGAGAGAAGIPGRSDSIAGEGAVVLILFLTHRELIRDSQMHLTNSTKHLPVGATTKRGCASAGLALDNQVRRESGYCPSAIEHRHFGD